MSWIDTTPCKIGGESIYTIKLIKSKLPRFRNLVLCRIYFTLRTKDQSEVKHAEIRGDNVIFLHRLVSCRHYKDNKIRFTEVEAMGPSDFNHSRFKHLSILDFQKCIVHRFICLTVKPAGKICNYNDIIKLHLPKLTNGNLHR